MRLKKKKRMQFSTKSVTCKKVTYEPSKGRYVKTKKRKNK